MPLATVNARALLGIDALPVTVEVEILPGLPKFSIVGLAETAVKEARHRVCGAFRNSQFEFPHRHIIVNLSPADLPKEGGRFDLAIAVGILAAGGHCSQQQLDQFEFLAELSLTGNLRSAPGALLAAYAASQQGRALITSSADAIQAACVKQATVYGADDLQQVMAHLVGLKVLQPMPVQETVLPKSTTDLVEIKGQQQARRVLEVAASGGHGLLLQGPPGTGKTMLASRLPTLLPALTDEQALEVAMVQSIASRHGQSWQWGQRPFRSPHHSATMPAIIGGGSPPRPGEISLAHHGVLFLDELPEFSHQVLEALREPMEQGEVTIARAKSHVTFPAQMQWVAAMNPCPCGYAGDERGLCNCTEEQVQRYQRRLSGPLLDRIDLQITVSPPSYESLLIEPSQPVEDSATVRQRVCRIHDRQHKRCHVMNAHLSVKQIERFCELSVENKKWLADAMRRLHLSIRRYHRILRVARTLADMSDDQAIQRCHLVEAISYQRAVG